MSESGITHLEDVDGSSSFHQPTVGRELQLAREAKGLSLAEAAEALKLGTGQIEALENDNWQALPGVTFIRGFVRNYGRLLGLDTGHLMKQLDTKLDVKRPELALPEHSNVAMPEPAGRLQLRDYLFPVVGVLLIVLAVLIYFFMPDDIGRLRSGAQSIVDAISGALNRQSGSVPTPVQQPVTSAPVEQPVLPPGSTVSQVLNPQAIEPAPAELSAVNQGPASVPPVVSQPPMVPQPVAPAGVAAVSAAPLHLIFSQESWVEVRDRRGNVVFSQNGTPGNERDIDGQAPFALVIGNAKNVKVMYRGQAVDLTPHIRGDVARLTLE